MQNIQFYIQDNAFDSKPQLITRFLHTHILHDSGIYNFIPQSHLKLVDKGRRNIGTFSENLFLIKLKKKKIVNSDLIYGLNEN